MCRFFMELDGERCGEWGDTTDFGSDGWGFRLPFDLYALDIEGKREFGAKSPPMPSPKRKGKGGPKNLRRTIRC